ncbi:thiol reductant ABC exporter subunit CydC [Arthrobacter glacialis]|uniref:Thiol reductant ABC exporter subunit CydC n=1 Tax=Arthrobacter glacialis TaxID=1664 RepID=A0A2S3ZVM1_ARTGL|nr:thiol reductant ABC exporter subunit CydC [Arthrobacter glacialis]POH73250.1 thiol reductant ABC exporter subunit CydC [Arthrobacter glacialis]
MSPRPVLPAGKSTRLALAGLAGLAAIKAVALVLLMGALAHALGQWAAGAPLDTVKLLVQGGLGAGFLGASVWGQQILARRAALGTKEELRAKLVAHRLSPRAGRSGGSVGAEGMLASRGLDGLDNYFSAYLPALVTCAVLPVMVGVQILISDWVSALIVVLTVPLVPVFMILIGFHTQERVELAASGLDRLSNHLLELARGLPVLVGLRRARAQRKALANVCEAYRTSTMATLRTAFLSSMALELISTISVAVVAVFIGVRLVYGGMPLEAGLLALMLAPECYRPLRDLGAAHHGSEDGVEALRRVTEILEHGSDALQDPPAAAALEEAGQTAPAASNDKPQNAAMWTRHLTVRYPGRSAAAVQDFTASLAPGEALVLSTASGTGKSTVLAALAGVLPSSGDGAAETTGSLHVPAPEALVFVSQHPVFTEDTVLAELALYAGGPAAIEVDESALMSALATVNAAHLAHRAVADCSPGELRRVAVARALARIGADPGVELALFDEPTAHLDRASAAAVRQALAALEGSVAVVAATHDQLLAGMLGCIQRIDTAASDGRNALVDPLGTAEPAGQVDADMRGSTASQPHELPPLKWRHLRHLPLRSPRFAAGVLVAVLAMLCAAALSGISGWLIVWAAERPPMLYLLTLIVGVRTFGIGRSVLRYSERLLVHDAVFRWASELRLKLWDSLGSSVLHWGKLTRTGGALGTLVADVDELRDAVPRAVVPIPAAILSYGAVLLSVYLLVPEVAGLVVVVGILSLVVLPVLVLAAQRKASAAAAVHRVWLAGRVTTLLAAADQLAANGVGGVQTARFVAEDAQVAKPLRRLAWADGFGQSAVSVLTAVAAVAVTIAAIGAGVDPRAAAVAALLMLALSEPFSQFIEAVSALPALATLMRRTLPLLDVPPTVVAEAEEIQAAASSAAAARVTTVSVEAIAARYPQAQEPVFAQVSGGVQRGQWWSVSGPSGSGKSTLLAVLLGFLRPEAGRYTLNGDPATAATLARIAWCPQDAYLFNSTLRANLALAKPAASTPSDAELSQALSTVGLGPWFASLPLGLDTRVGPGGHHLSGGQRTRVSVARTLVAGADVVLLDEPTAHLGQDEAGELVRELRDALAGAAVVLVTHDDELAQGADTHLRLGVGEAAAQAARA